MTRAFGIDVGEFLHFFGGEAFAWPALRIQEPPRWRCPVYGVRSRLPLAVFRG
jgi:hypothetical protein